MKQESLSKGQLRRIEKALRKVPFAKLIGIELEKVDPGVAILSLKVRRDLKQNNGVVHGGAMASLIDTAAAFAVISVLPPEERATTADLTISYLRPLTSGRIRCTARILRAGRRLIVVSAEATNAAGNLAATALTTYIKI